MSEGQGESMAQRYARLTGKDEETAAEELGEALRSSFEVSKERTTSPYKITWFDALVTPLEDLQRLFDEVPQSPVYYIPDPIPEGMAPDPWPTMHITPVDLRYTFTAVDAEVSPIIGAMNRRPVDTLIMQEQSRPEPDERFARMETARASAALDEWPHNRSREAWERARAERWPDPSWSSLRKVQRWEEMRREGLMQWEGHEPAFFRHRTTDGWMTRHNWEWDELKERRALFYATQKSARPGQYLPTRGPAGVRARARACGLESDANTLLCFRARYERAVDEGRMSHAEVPVWRIAGNQVYLGGGLVGWFRHLDPLVARYAEDPMPTAETPPLYRDDTTGRRAACEVER